MPLTFCLILELRTDLSAELCLYRHSSAERDLRAQVTRRKISSGTRSDKGRDSRDACLSLLKTCNKVNVSFWDYLGSRFQVPDAPEVPRLATLVVQNTGPPELVS